MQLEVYPTDAEALDAAAAVVAERLRAGASGGSATAVLAGGRPGRGLMVALAARGDVPWDRVEWFLADERCGAAGDPLAHAKAARESLFAPRGVAAGRVHVPDPARGAPDAVAAAWAADLEAALGTGAAVDVVALPLGADGRLGSLPREGDGLDAAADVSVVRGADGVPRVTITQALVARARHVVVTAVGPEVAGAVAAALRDGAGPAARVLPSERVTWLVDRDAASALLKDARPVEG